MGDDGLVGGCRVWVGPVDGGDGAGVVAGVVAFGKLVKSFEFTVSQQIVAPQLGVFSQDLWKQWEIESKYHDPGGSACDIYRVVRHDPVLSDIEIAHVIRETITTIKQYGWAQNAYGNVLYGFCVLGAIGHVTGRLSATTGQITDRFSRWLKNLGEESSIPEWNDDRARTKEEVILYLHKFADELDPVGAGEPLLKEIG